MIIQSRLVPYRDFIEKTERATKKCLCVTFRFFVFLRVIAFGIGWKIIGRYAGYSN